MILWFLVTSRKLQRRASFKAQKEQITSKRRRIFFEKNLNHSAKNPKDA